jgi:hypothetical protein
VGNIQSKLKKLIGAAKVPADPKSLEKVACADTEEGGFQPDGLEQEGQKGQDGESEEEQYGGMTQ